MAALRRDAATSILKTLYLDIFSGISGDMFIGAMLDLGADLPRLEQELAKLSLAGYHLHAHRAKRGEIEGVKFDVHLGHDHHHEHEHGHHHEHDHRHEHEHPHEHEHGRNYAEIKAMIAASGLSDWVKQGAQAVFLRVAAAEGKIHGMPVDQVHFHEVGAVDSIVDIVGGCIALEILGRPRVVASAAVEGAGWIKCAHGRFPIPAPATLEILAARGVVLTQCDEPHELITPTGAALLAEFVEEFGLLRGMKVERVGFGVGTRENKTRPNVLRAVLGESAGSEGHDWETDTIAVLETNLDDLSPEMLGSFLETALMAGALDVFHTPIQMKKNRPGVLLTVLCAATEADKFSEMILRQTSAFGVRRSTAERRKLRREFRTVKTVHGEVTIKLGLLDGHAIQVAPEFESCRKIAVEKNVPVAEVYRAALSAYSAKP